MAVPVHHHARGETRLVAQPVKLSRTPASVYVSAPDAGEHSDEILTELGKTSGQVLADLASADPLSTEVMQSIAGFRETSIQWAGRSEEAFARARSLPYQWVALQAGRR